MRRLLRRGVAGSLPAGYDVDTHFNPATTPGTSGSASFPTATSSRRSSSGRAEIVTDGIETFTETGIRLASGRELEADIIVTATGLNLLLLGGIEIAVDGREIDAAETITYKGMMLSGVPNLAFALGYTNASWTLKCDLVAKYVCRLLNHMDEHGYAFCTPRPPGPDVEIEPILDLESGYVLRSIDDLPKQGARPPWRLHQNYARDIVLLRWGSLDDEAMEFSRGDGSAVDADATAAASGWTQLSPR